MTTRSTVEVGKEVYERIRPSIELKFPNQFVSIEVVSKEYFIDPSMGQAIAKAKARYPHGEFYTVKIGKDTAMTMMR